MRKLKGIDLFCGAGGASVGYQNAGFEMVGIDIVEQPYYPHPFILGNALEIDLAPYDFVAASPPCQHYSNSWSRTKHKDKEYPDLIKATRERIKSFNKPYVIENVQGAKSELINPIKLCGTMFGIQVFRHRMFEFGGGLETPKVPFKCNHKGKRGITPYYKEGNMYTVCGVGGGWGTVQEWQKAMGINWMPKKKPLSQAIPPIYTEWIGKHVMKQLKS